MRTVESSILVEREQVRVREGYVVIDNHGTRCVT
jgi:hypothetical protein